jgi:hypothetical protein
MLAHMLISKPDASKKKTPAIATKLTGFATFVLSFAYSVKTGVKRATNAIQTSSIFAPFK